MNDAADSAPRGEAWPFQEARKLLARQKPGADAVLFETGYGPSGLPHIGTFGEVVRTSMVRQAFAALTDTPSRLIAFSDDMDGLRGIPDNIPNPERIREHLGKPLTSVPDPFGKFESFGHHNNAMFRRLLDDLGVAYEFRSATDCYKSGVFDEMLLRMLERHDEVRSIVLPTLGAERRATYSPFLPVSPDTGRVLQVPLVAWDADAGTIVYDEDGKRIETPVTGGRCKLQWKADWAMRWAAFGVDYEMSGKDLIDSVRLSTRICKALGGRPPETYIYELFLDENGEKISKSRGNGLTLDEWLAVASPESLKMYMFHAPRRAKRLFFDVIPRAFDDYLDAIEKYPAQTPEDQRNNPAWFLHNGAPPREDVPVTFSMLLNLAGVANTDDRKVLWGFVSRYAPDTSPEKNPLLDAMVGYAIAYYRTVVYPAKRHRAATVDEAAAMRSLIAALEALPDDAVSEDIQSEVYAVGRAHGYENLRAWFQVLYEVLFGQSQGPRMGSFIQLYGMRDSIALIRRALDGELVGEAAEG
ncbi:MAG: lysine--tRNA ligase [Proteobacteria bacterium]|nr:lysine--tRNA ligase [Pseudomonadota bacterium]MDA1132615.1 lysine--tRNA ligase [Pseudomonadota bacterium]